MQIKKLTRIGVLILSLLAFVFWFFIAGSDSVNEQGKPDGGFMTSPFIFMAFLTVIVAVALTLFYSLKGLFASKDLKKNLMPFAIFIGLFLVCLVIANGGEVVKDNKLMMEAGFGSRMVSAVLNMFYILISAAFFLLIYASFGKLKK